MGGVVGGQWNDKLRQLESLVWGNTVQASQIQIKIRAQENIKIGRTEKLYKELENKPGARYLLYSPFLPQKGSEKRQRLEYIAPDSLFNLTMASQMDHFLDLSVASLWLLVWLGALGTRSRRGAGVLQFKEPISYEWRHDQGIPPLPLTAPSSPQDLQEKLSKGLRTIKEIFTSFAKQQGFGLGIIPDLPSFDLISENYFLLVVTQRTWEEWWKALDDLGRKYQSWRRGHRDERAYLGLPLLGDKRRRASPLLIRPVWLTNKYSLLAAVFKAKYTSEDPSLPQAAVKFLETIKENFGIYEVSPYDKLSG